MTDLKLEVGKIIADLRRLDAKLVKIPCDDPSYPGCRICGALSHLRSLIENLERLNPTSEARHD